MDARQTQAVGEKDPARVLRGGGIATITTLGFLKRHFRINGQREEGLCTSLRPRQKPDLVREVSL